MRELPAGTVTFLFTDVEGSTRLLERYPETYRDAIARHHRLLEAAVEDEGGVVFETVGDAVYAAFDRPSRAVAAAVRAQLGLRSEPSEEFGPLEVRMGLHTGEVERQGAHYFGRSLYRCARLMAAAHGGQVLLSAATTELVRDDLAPETHLRDLGSHRLKDLARPERIFQLVHPALPADFPPPRGVEGRPNNLPVQLTSFVGRAREIAEVKALLALDDAPAAGAPRLVTLTGSGGTGKTRLALQVAADLLEDYQDGVWLAELARVEDAEQVPRVVAATLGVQEGQGRSVLDALTAALQPKRFLLVLDSCEHVLEACAALVEALLLACPSLRVLSTSHEPLGVAGEVNYHVPPLSYPDSDEDAADDPGSALAHLRDGRPGGAEDEVATAEQARFARLVRSEAVQLFVERARLARPGFALQPQNADLVAQICTRLDGIPLAIELAAARLHTLSVAEIAARVDDRFRPLDDRFRLLTGGTRTALPRQQTLQAIVEWSYGLLAPKERLLLRRLAVFVGGRSAAAVEAVCAGEGIEREEVLGLLAQLVQKSLLTAEPQPDGETRYWLTETIWQYAWERLREANELETLKARRLAWCLSLAEQAAPELRGPRRAQWLDRLWTERGNLVSCLAYCEERGEVEAGLRLAAAMGPVWAERGSLQDGRERLASFLAASTAPASSGGQDAAVAARIGALWAAYDLARRQGDEPAAAALAEEAHAMCAGAGDEAGTARARVALGVAAAERGEYAEATRLLEEGLSGARRGGDGAGTVLALAGLGEVAHGQGDGARAAGLFDEGLSLAQAVGDTELTAVSLLGRGHVALADGDVEDAAGWFTECLARCRAAGAAYYQAAALTGLAGVAAAQGELALATRWLGAVGAYLDARGAVLDPPDRRAQECQVARVRAQLGEPAWSTAWREGRATPLGQAVAAVLDTSPGPALARRARGQGPDRRGPFPRLADRSASSA